MADPFEVRMRFTSQLQHLNASTSSAIKAANYALRYAEFSDDLHSCILEQLERNNMNNRANIMYFLPALCDAAKAQGETGYVRMMERDIGRIIDLVAPDDGSGAANVKVVRKVLLQLQQKQFLLPRTVAELDEFIVGRDGADPMGAAGIGGDGAGTTTAGGARGPALASSPPLPLSARMSLHPQQQHQQAHPVAARAVGPAGETGEGWTRSSTPQSDLAVAAGQFFATGMRLDKRQIEQRIEEDRERHKRAREHIWAIPQGVLDPAVDEEFVKVWWEVGEVVEDDYQLAREEAEERRRHLEFDDS